MSEPMKPLTVELPYVHEFQWRTERYGRLMFDLCLKYKYSKLSEAWLYSHGPDGSAFRVPVPKDVNGFYLSSYGEGLKDSRVWIGGWCKEHKAHSMSFYVPDNSRYVKMQISLHKLSIEMWREHPDPDKRAKEE